MLASLLAEGGQAFTSARDLEQAWKARGGSRKAFQGTLLAFRVCGYVDEIGLPPVSEHRGVIRGSYRLREGYLENRKARAAKGATRAFEAIYEPNKAAMKNTTQPTA